MKLRVVVFGRKKITTEMSPRLFEARVLLALLGFSYPAWIFIVRAIEPEAYDPIFYRLLIGAYAGIAILLTYVSYHFKKRPYPLLEVGVYVMMFHLILISAKNNLSPVYLFGIFLAFFTGSIVFSSNFKLSLFTLFTIGLTALTTPLDQAGIPSYIYFAVILSSYCVTAVNNTVKHRMMNSLERSKERLAEILNQLPVGAIYETEDTLHFNHKARELSKYSALDFVSHEEALSHLFPEIISQHKASTGEGRFSFDKPRVLKMKRKDGEYKDVELWSYHDQTTRIWLLVDETEKIKAKANLLYSSKMVSLGEMAGGIAHEINNPLTIINGVSDMLEFDLKEENSSQASLDKVAKIKTMIFRIAKIVNSLRKFARNEDSSQAKSVSAAKDIIEEALALCEEKLRSNFVKVDIDVPDEDLNINCHPIEITQILINLISNSHDAVRDLEEKWIRIEAREQGDYIEFSVSDSGKGLSVDLHDKIMQPFYTTKDIGSGTGLGLSISRSIAEDHHGSLTLDPSCENTRFVLLLPVVASEKIAS